MLKSTLREYLTKTKIVKALKITGLLFLPLGLFYLLGPKPARPALQAALPEVNGSLQALSDSIQASERAIANLKPDNEARIIWADSIPKRTPWAVVYLPGFTATYMEGEPIHREFAERFGCNLYVPRWPDHGLSEEDLLLDYHPDTVLATAAHALAIGHRLGERVLLMSTSTGGTLSLLLAAQLPDKVDALITFSPNIAIKSGSVRALTWPWGLQIARQMVGGPNRSFEAEEEFKKYWYHDYRLEGLVQLQNLVAHGMKPATFQAVKQPFFMGYYYKNETEQDDVVSVEAMLEMYEQLGTPSEQKRKVAFPNVGNHALASYVGSKDLESVRRAIFAFGEEVLGF